MKLKKRQHQPEPRRNRSRSVQNQGSGKVFSYYASKSTDSERLATRRQRKDEAAVILSERKQFRAIRLRRLGLLLVGVLLLTGFAVYNALLDGTAKVTVRGSEQQSVLLQDISVYGEAVNTILQDAAGSRTKFSVDTRAIEQEIITKFPEVAVANVGVPLFGKHINVTLQPAEPSVLFTATDGSSYVLNELGRVIAPHGSQVLGATVPLVNDQSGLRIDVGGQALSASEIEFIETIIFQLKAQNITVRSFTLPQSAGQMHAYIESRSYYVKFTFHADPLRQVGSYVATQKKLEADRVTPAEYVDARVEGRTYYR